MECAAATRAQSFDCLYADTSVNWRVPFAFHLNRAKSALPDERLILAHGDVPMRLIRNPRARRYVLRLNFDGSARVTIPRGGSAVEARRFAERNTAWFERALERLATRPMQPKAWVIGSEIHFRGELARIKAGVSTESGQIRFGTEVIKAMDPAADLRALIERHLWRLAAIELRPKVHEYAPAHQITVRRVTIRNQKSRWGSCSQRGTISLNWRLIQTPPFVQEYLILHELTHFKHMNHSTRFWCEVERVCPGYEAAEGWLKQHSALLR